MFVGYYCLVVWGCVCYVVWVWLVGVYFGFGVLDVFVWALGCGCCAVGMVALLLTVLRWVWVCLAIWVWWSDVTV